MKTLFKALPIICALLSFSLGAHAAGLKYKDGDVISKDTSWCGYVTVSGVVFIPEGVTVTIEPGTTVKFVKTDAEYRESGLSEAVIPGSGLRVEGVITAKGDSEHWITFTSAEKKPAPGDWGCIYFDHSKGSVFEYCRFEYARYTVHAHFSQFDASRCVFTGNVDGSRLGYSRASYTHCDIKGNAGKGLNFANCRNTVKYCNITGNDEGIFLNQKDTACVIEHNNIYDNGFDLFLGDFHDEDVNLGCNWWGTTDMAVIAGKVYDEKDDPEIGEARLDIAACRQVNAGLAGLEAVELWKFRTGGFVDSSPAVVDGIVYFGSWDKSLYALKSRTGELLWKFDTGDCVDSSPAVDGGKVYFGSWDRNIYCLNAETGREVWRYEMEPSNFDDHRQSSPAVWDAGPRKPPVVVAGGFNGRIYSLVDGVGKGEAATGGPVRSRPAVAGLGASAHGLRISQSRVFVGSGDGSLYAVDMDNSGGVGQVRWRYETWGAVNSSPAVRGNRVYFGSRDGRLYCVDKYDGKPLWSFVTGGMIEYSSPLLAEDMAIIGSTDGKLYAVKTDDGSLVWTFDTGDVIYSSPVLADGMVVTSNNGGDVYWVDQATGAPKAVFHAGDAVQGLSAGPDGVVYAGSRDGFLHALSIVR